MLIHTLLTKLTLLFLGLELESLLLIPYLPTCRNMFFPDIKGNVKLYQLTFDADLSSASHIDPWNQPNTVVSC
jgi:hypothetical protein